MDVLRRSGIHPFGILPSDRLRLSELPSFFYLFFQSNPCGPIELLGRTSGSRHYRQSLSGCSHEEPVAGLTPRAIERHHGSAIISNATGLPWGRPPLINVVYVGIGAIGLIGWDERSQEI